MIIIFLLVCFFLVSPGLILADGWEFDPSVPQYDPLWEQIDTLWQNHRGANKIDNVIDLLHELEKKYPDRIEPLLWLGKTYFMKGAWSSKDDKKEKLEKSVAYALSAHAFDSSNIFSFRVLVSCLPYLGDINFAMNNYGEWITKIKPLSTGRVLAEIAQGQDWETAVAAWDNRADISQAKKAVNLFKQIADKDPQNGSSLIWVCRGFYYLGYYYMAEQNEEFSLSYFHEGVKYGEKALKILPDSVPANFWFALNFGRTIQNMSLIKKAIKFRPLLSHTMFCLRENPLYFYYGPVLVLGTTITRGGWVVKKVMQRHGLTLDNVLNGLELAELLYPNYLYIPYCKAEIYADIGRIQEAKGILKKVSARAPDGSTYHSAENRVVIKLSKILLDRID